MNITKNFSFKEMTYSTTAIRLGIDNTPSMEHVINLCVLTSHILQPVRDNFGKVVTVNSGYRSPELNAAINGSSKASQHCNGQACDFEIMGISNQDLATWIYENLEYDQLILEFHEPSDINSGWVHCSFKNTGDNRGNAMIINKETKGKYVPWEPPKK